MNIPYKSYTIQLTPKDEMYSFGVLGRVFLEDADGPGTPLFHTTFMNEFTNDHGGKGYRTSRQSALKVIKRCKEWIDRRAELYAAIQKVVSEESCRK